MDLYAEMAKIMGRSRSELKAMMFLTLYSDKPNTEFFGLMQKIKDAEQKGIPMSYDYIFSLRCNLGTFFSVRLTTDEYRRAYDELWRVFRSLPGMAEREGHDAGYTVMAWAWRPHSDAPLPKEIRIDPYTCRITNDPGACDSWIGLATKEPVTCLS